jgi:ABC-type phosphate transport system permease subunit
MAGLTQDPFTFGFFSGALFILALTPFVFWMNIWIKDIKAFFNPQKVFQTTKKSPFSVMMQTLWHTLLTVVIVIIIGFFLYVYFYR